jgi:hypothetical protein
MWRREKEGSKEVEEIAEVEESKLENRKWKIEKRKSEIERVSPGAGREERR